MKKYLEKQIVFNRLLKLLSILAKCDVSERLISLITTLLARFNLLMNKPEHGNDVKTLAETWKALMPPDGQQYFKISEITNDTAYVEIHLHCPLRGSGKVETCHKFMNYDRRLMKSVGGSLTVLESQSNSGDPFCRLAIRKLEHNTDDLIPAHKKSSFTTDPSE